MAVNDVTYVNASNDVPPDDEGFFTYLLDPVTCTASDFQHFNTYNDWGAHTRLVDYLQALTDGRSFLYLLHFRSLACVKAAKILVVIL